MLIILAAGLVALFGKMPGTGESPAPTTAPVMLLTPASTPKPSLLDDIQVARRYSLAVEGNVLDNIYNSYPAPLFSPDGRIMLFKKQVTGRSELWRTDAQGRTVQRLLESVWHFAWSPDGEWIAYTQYAPQGKSSLWVMRPDGSEKRMVIEGIKTGQVSWLNGSRLVYVAADNAIIGISLDGAQVQQLVPPSEEEHLGREFALSSTGDRLVWVDDKFRLWLIKLNLGKTASPTRIDPFDGAFFGPTFRGIAWSPDGNQVAFASRTSIYCVDRDGSIVTKVLTAWEPSDLVWSPDGKTLAFIARTDERASSWEVFLTEGSAVKRLTIDNENIPNGRKTTLAWSPDGTKLIYGTLRLPGQKMQVIELGRGKNQGKSDRLTGVTSLSSDLSSEESNVPVISDCPYQGGNVGTIWVFREQYCPPEIPPEQCTRQIPFEEGVYQEDPSWSNYLGGVLEVEIGGTAETSLLDWQPAMARAFAIAARTVAAHWCPYSVVTDTRDGTTHYGLNDWRYQVYRPGWSAARAEEYRGFVADTAGQRLTYNGNLFDVQYRTYTGRTTYNRDPNGPHKGVSDPVAATDETPDPGLGQHSANHWAMGLHNERLGEPVNVLNVQWTDYRQILAHYYTGISIVNQAGQSLAPSARWNALDVVAPASMTVGQTYAVRVLPQNTGIAAWDNSIGLAYWWEGPIGRYDPPVTRVPAGNIAPGEVPGGGNPAPLTLSVSPPPEAVPGQYTLMLDMKQGDIFFSAGGWAPQPVLVEIVGATVTPTPTPTPTSTPAPPVTTTVEARVLQGSDDAGHDPGRNCAYSISSNEIYFGECYDGKNITSGFRFPNVPVPRGATIVEAYIRFTVDGPADR